MFKVRCLPLCAGSCRFEHVDIQQRLMPMQVLGKQATTTTFKAKAALRMLALESEVDDARLRVRSLLSDMGVESGLWSLPNIVGGFSSERCSPFRCRWGTSTIWSIM